MKVARDIDDWMFHFERQAALRLRQMFEVESASLPAEIELRLKLLRKAEDAVSRAPSAIKKPEAKK